MFTSQQFRAKAAEYGQLAKGTDQPGAIREFRRLERSYGDLADNDEWLADNFAKTMHPTGHDVGGGPNLNEEEGNVLHCLGAAVVMQWNTIPTKLQRELFENAGSVGELIQSSELKGRIAKFLHNHKDGGAAPAA